VDSGPLLNIADYAGAARGKLPQNVFDYYEGGALDEITLRENTAGWERLKLYYRVLAGVRPRNMSTTVLGQPVSMPIVVAPTAFHKLACEDGEIAAAKAAKVAKTLFILSSLSNTAMEAVFAEAASPRWFQLYIYKDREITFELVKRAEAAGAEAIVLTVDAPGLGTRERDTRNNFRLPEGLTVENLAPLGKGNFPEVKGSGLAAYVRANFKQDLGFDDLDWLCRSTELPVVVKGAVRGDDARRAAEHGRCQIARPDPSQHPVIELQFFPARGVLSERDFIQRSAFVIIENLLRKRTSRCARVISNIEKRLRVHRSQCCYKFLCSTIARWIGRSAGRC